MRLATDVGGTFTDLIAYDHRCRRFIFTKVPSTPPSFEDAVVHGVIDLGVDGPSLGAFIHGSTVVINTLTERRGQVVALITTRGFRDVLEIARGNRPDLYNLRYKKPPAFVERRLRFEVDERMLASGAPARPVCHDSVLEAANSAKEAGATAVAVCLLHSYANPAHELECGGIIQTVFPSGDITLSHQVTMEWREYERSMTAVLNAYVQRATSGYLDRLDEKLDQLGVDTEIEVMQSNGGTVRSRDARVAPIALVESGPVAGVVGAAAVGRAAGRPNVISLDIGGTTAKMSLVDNGEVRITTEYRVEARPDYAGYPIRAPTVDIVEIGAGGGSIVHFDEVGRLAVGPQSAGARPGPACYPDGGDAPTITDANLIMGRLDPRGFLDGRMPLSPERSREAFEPIAEALMMSVDEVARGAMRIATAKMVTALKLISVRRGYDPRDFALVSMGGAGPLHAAELAAQLRIGTVIVPPLPAVFSAWGMLTSERRKDWIRTRVTPADHPDAAAAAAQVWQDMECRAQDEFSSQGSGDVVVRRYVDARYAGQEHVVKLEVPGGTPDRAWVASTCDEFHREHARRFGFRLADPVTLVNFHLSATAAALAPLGARPQSGGPRDAAPPCFRMVDFDSFGVHESQIHDRADIRVGQVITGPAIVDEGTSGTLLRPGDTAISDDAGNLCLTISHD